MNNCITIQAICEVAYLQLPTALQLLRPPHITSANYHAPAGSVL